MSAAEEDPSSAPAPQLTITIKPLKGGQSFTLPVSRLEPIDDLKLRVAAKSGVPASHQRLVFGGKALLEGKTLLDFGIGDGATVHLLKKAGAEKAEVSAAAPVPAEKVKEAKPAAGATKEDGFVSVVKEKGNDPAFWADLRSTLQSHFGADSQHVDKVRRRRERVVDV
ncbi:hypothetical protein HK097_006181 [Rhizophlyctis rosea]|uniref:Ubiquitin-like domain-containing protein n=1 Tax=Rhizophlyctis rosea TaxID=64517 RepID=A0AAD5X602_9FUNG|nr:hypothetical protein HK097_006181 [Rhizophlyctis rosea]